jgi:hypothetical protein|tara:strand:- start:979 stop:3183 length:2205 start_codon:yes stop_codon:yes gene_type:complete
MLEVNSEQPARCYQGASVAGASTFIVRNSAEGGPGKQSGQAMVLGLMFLATALMFMLFMYNQGQLTRHRVQLENAADATVYSQAKLAARNQNFIAYTNRAMVANEVSIGQVNALMSWSARYRDMSRYTQFPLYKVPLGPIPVTVSDVLSVVTLPYVLAGTAINAATRPLSLYWPEIISYFNSGIGVFQGLFALSTVVAQFEVNQDVVKGNQLESDNADIYAPFISFYFLVQNTLMTYAGDNFDPGPAVTDLEDRVGKINLGGGSTAGEVVGSYFPGETMISPNSPSRTKGSNAAGTLAAYQYYSAIVNRNKDPFTDDRHWRFWQEVPDIIPRIKLDMGIFALTIDLDLTIGMGVKSDGGSTYGANGGLDSANDIKKLGWAAVDVTSFGVEIGLGLFIKARVCFIFACKSFTLLDVNAMLSLGLPLGAGGSQTVSKNQYAKKVVSDWAPLGERNGKYGGDPNNSFNDGAFSPFHTVTLLWAQMPQNNIYGPPKSVNTKYSGPPMFLSMGEKFRKSRRSLEYTVALAIDLDDIETSDNEKTFNIGNSAKTPAESWLDGNEKTISYTRFDLDTCARTEEASAEGLWQQGIWGSKRAMTTISSAETYFSNPMQSYADGSEEPASLFSPFWEARLIEPSFIPQLIASGSLPYDEILGQDVPDDAIGVTKWLLKKMGDQLVDQAISSVSAEIKYPYKPVVIKPLQAAGNAAKAANRKVADKLADGLTQFVGVVGGDNCAG